MALLLLLLKGRGNPLFIATGRGRMSRITLLSLFLSLNLFADDWMPSARHFEAAGRGQDCAIYRSIAARAQVSLDQSEDAELHFSEVLKVRRAELKSCAESRSIDVTQGEEAEQLAAEACPVQYEAWVKTGYRFRANLQDRDSARHSLAVMQSNLGRSCGDSARLSPAAFRIE
jgi:hypothetical protein